MLVGIIVTIVIFFVVRFLASLCVTRPAVYNASGAAAVLIFLLGLWAGATLFGAPAPVAAVITPPAVAIASPVTTSSASTATIHTPQASVRHAPASHTTIATGSPALAAIDATTTDPHLGYAPPGNIFPTGSTIYVRGWAASSSKTRLKRLIFVIDHHLAYDGTANYGVPRPDVAKAYNAPAMTSTGYSAVALPTNGLGTGTHTLQIGGIGDNSQRYHLAPVSVTFKLQ